MSKALFLKVLENSNCKNFFIFSLCSLLIEWKKRGVLKKRPIFHVTFCVCHVCHQLFKKPFQERGQKHRRKICCFYFITVGNVSTTPTQFSSLGWKKKLYVCVHKWCASCSCHASAGPMTLRRKLA